MILEKIIPPRFKNLGSFTASQVMEILHIEDWATFSKIKPDLESFPASDRKTLYTRRSLEEYLVRTKIRIANKPD